MKIKIKYAGALLFVIFLMVPEAMAQIGEGSSPFDPAPAGVRLSGIVECGRGYTSHELYNMKITLQEVLRGKDAWKLLKKARKKTNLPAKVLNMFLLA